MRSSAAARAAAAAVVVVVLPVVANCHRGCIDLDDLSRSTPSRDHLVNVLFCVILWHFALFSGDLWRFPAFSGALAKSFLYCYRKKYASSRVLAYCGSFHHVTNVISKKNEARDQLVSPTKINKKRERETTSPKPWASPAVAASVAHAPPARVMAR